MLQHLFDPVGLTPHGFCLAWQPGLIWLHAVSDILIALSYYSIPIALLVLARRKRDLAYPWILWLFAAFIVACGTTHVFGALTLWVPAYWLDGLTKALTAALSVTTAILLWPLIPQILKLPSQHELREINTRLAQSEARYRSLFIRAPAAMHSLDRDRRIVEVSNAWLDLLGHRRDEVIGQLLDGFQDPEAAETMRRGWPPAPPGGVLRDMDRRYTRKTGEIRDMQVSVSIDDTEGDWRCIGVLQDVTAQRRAEHALHESEARLRQSEKLGALGQLAGGIAHDFNNVLQAVAGAAALIRRRADDAAVVDRLAAMIEEAAERGSSVGRRLLAFARHTELRAEAVNPTTMLTGLAEVLTYTLGGSVHVALDIATDLPNIWADRGQLETVLVNLATNARDAMPSGGVVTLAATRTQTENGEPQLLLSVIDAGEGMDAATLARATEPFFTTKPDGRGTGLGLSIARSFAERSGGRLVVASAAGQGTRVDLFLPAHTADALDVPEAVVEFRPAPPAHRILFVDDEPLLREIVAEQLAEEGFTVVVADSGVTALALLAGSEKVDALVTDLSMPHMDGIELIEHARRLRPALPAFVLTGFIGDRARDGAGYTIIRKPATTAALAEQVRHGLSAVTIQ